MASKTSRVHAMFRSVSFASDHADVTTKLYGHPRCPVCRLYVHVLSTSSYLIGTFRRNRSNKFSRKITWFYTCRASIASTGMNTTARLSSESRLEHPLLQVRARAGPRHRGLGRPMRLEKGMNLAHREGNSLLGFFPGEDAHLCLWREHRALHGDGIWVRGDLVRQDQDRVLATPHEIACHGEHEVGVGLEHLGDELVGRLQRDLGPFRGQHRTPALPKCAWVLRVAHLRTPAHGLRQHGCGNASGCAL